MNTKMKEKEARILKDRIDYIISFIKEKHIKEELEDIIFQINCLVTDENGWIPVTERLPDKAGNYLVTSELNYYHGGCWDTNDDGTTHSMAIAYYDGTDKIGRKNYWNHGYVKAWQPLPEIYRDKL